MTASESAESLTAPEIKRWTAKRKAAVVLDLIKGKTTATEAARTHDLTVAQIETWRGDSQPLVAAAARGH